MQYVYVLNRRGEPMMPCSSRKARILLRNKKARVVKRTPFTVQLLYGSSGYKQPVTLGVDAGSKHIGLSASTEAKELYAEELQPRNDVVKLLSARRELRRGRRHRKTRYRAPRFGNRVRSKHKGWLAPSVEVKIQEHITAVEHICRLLPITKVVVETAEFDTQRLKADLLGLKRPEGAEYQQGEQLGHYNVRQYVLFRDEYTCRCCGAHGDGVKLHIHHCESRRVGGNSAANLVTVCEKCHKNWHAGVIEESKLWKRKAPSMRDAAFMGIMRKTLLERLRCELLIPVMETHGYITKYWREKYCIEKSHTNDARCIAGHPLAEPCDVVFRSKALRRHNRQTHKAKPSKGGVRRRNQTPYLVKGFRLWDKVLYNGQECFITGRRSSGYFALKMLDGTAVSNSASYKQLSLVEISKNKIIERSARTGTQFLPTAKAGGILATVR